MRILITILVVFSLIPPLVFGARHVPNQIIVKTRAPLTTQSSVQAKLQKHGITILNRLGGEHEKTSFPLGTPGRLAPYGKDSTPLLSNVYLLDVDSSESLDAVIQDLEADENVLYAEPNHLLKPFATVMPNDPNFSAQPNLLLMELPEAWSLTLATKDIVIAIVDTGVNWNHNDLNDHIWNNSDETINGIDSDGNGFVDDIRGWDFANNDNDPDHDCDTDGHGSHVAGIAAAESNNGIGITGVAFNTAKIMPLAVASGVDCELPVSAVAPAIKYAADNGANIINMSFGGQGVNDTLKEAVDYALARKLLLVAAAGNEQKNIDTDPDGPIFPASYPGVLTVSAVDDSGKFASFSNFGDSVDVAAPGIDIRSTSGSGSGYAIGDGTSFSSPHVAGLGALVMSLDSSFDGEDAFQIITSGVSSNVQGKSPRLGYGLANARIALALIQPTALLNPSSDPTIFGPNGFLSKVINHPNPFNPDSEITKIFFYLSKTSTVLIKIYSMNLDLTKTILLSNLSQGDYEIPWDGRDVSGDIVPNGVYVMVIEATGIGHFPKILFFTKFNDVIRIDIGFRPPKIVGFRIIHEHRGIKFLFG